MIEPQRFYPLTYPLIDLTEPRDMVAKKVDSGARLPKSTLGDLNKP